MATNPMTRRATADPVSLEAALAAGKKVAPDAMLLLAQDHAEAMSWFRWAEEASPDMQPLVVRRLCAALRAHMAIEEEIFYPAARQALGDDALVEHAYQEHEQAKRLMDRLAPAASSDVTLDEDALEELRHAIRAHVQEEETQLFPRLRGSGLDFHALGRRLAARRAEALVALIA